MKPSVLISFWLFCQLLPFSGKSDVPYTQHPLPIGVNVSSARPSTIDIDAAGNKWLTFANAGIGMFDGTNWFMYNTQNSSIPSDSTTCSDFDASGNLWVGTKLGAAYKSGNNWTVYNSGNSGLPTDIIRAVFVDGNTTWFGTYNGLTSFDGTNWITYNTLNSGIVNDSVLVIRKDPTGQLWIGTRNGLSGFFNNTWTNYTNQNSVLGRAVIDIECGLDGNLWLVCGYFINPGYISGIGVNFIEAGVVNTFHDDLYFYESDFAYATSDIAINAQGEVFVHVLGNNFRSLFKVTPQGLTTINLPGINYGTSTLGSRMEFDATGKLWIMARLQYALYSLDLSASTVSLNDNWLNNFRELDINEVVAGMNANGDKHWDHINPKYEVPKGLNKHSVFASTFWIGGIDAGGQLHQAAETYRQTGSDFWPGPIAAISIPFDSVSSIAFDRVWKIDKWKIEEFKTQFLAGNVSNGSYQVPEEFKTWPAKGNNIVNESLAPFTDANGDGLYDPYDGDYPLIKGDQMLYNIFNDALGIHTTSGGSPMYIEVQSSAYAFNCTNGHDSIQALNYTTFYNYKIINRSSVTYNDVYLALWTDYDLGNATDDYVGCDSTRATGFVYNGDNDDGPGAGYGINPPMQNTKILSGPIADEFDIIDNDLDGTIDEPGETCTMNHFMYYNNVNNSPTGNPGGPWDYYYLSQSKWLDGMHLTYGADGRDPSNPPTNFMFSGVPFSGSGWTEFSSGNPPEDRRVVMGSGSFTFEAGDTIDLDFAYVFTWDSINPNGLTTSIARNILDLDRVQNWFNNNSYPSCENYTTGIAETQNTFLTVYPNPATTYLNIQNASQTINGNRYKIYNTLGAEVQTGYVDANGIDVRYFDPGFYILKIEMSDEVKCVKFVKK